MAKAKGFTITKESIAQFKAKEAAKTPAQRLASSRDTVEQNTLANRIKPKKKA